MVRGRTQQIHNNNNNDDDDHIADGHKFIASLANNSNNDGNLAICPVRCLTPNRKYQVEGSAASAAAASSFSSAFLVVGVTTNRLTLCLQYSFPPPLPSQESNP